MNSGGGPFLISSVNKYLNESEAISYNMVKKETPKNSESKHIDIN